jgi:hypothetical protein
MASILSFSNVNNTQLKMKYFFIILLTLGICGCNKIGKAHFEFTGITPGIKSGVVIIKNEKDSVVFGVNIKDGKFTINNPLNDEGYYKVNITITNKTDFIKPFEVYLED